MGKMIGLELKKVKHTFLQVLLFISLIGPVAMIFMMYGIDGKNTFSNVVISNSVFVQVIPFAITVIFGCFIVAREYKDTMIIYQKITPQSQIKILLSKMIVVILETCITQIFVFLILFIMNTAADGYDMDLLRKYIGAGLISAATLSCLVPLMIYISLIRRSYSSASLLFLILFMLTFPYIFSENGAMFPHLLPMILVAKYFGNSLYDNISFQGGFLVLLAIAAIFIYLSIRKVKAKE